MQHKQRFPSSLLIYDIIQTKVYQFARPAIYEHKLLKKKLIIQIVTITDKISGLHAAIRFSRKHRYLEN
jgi:hypothetical protein